MTGSLPLSISTGAYLDRPLEAALDRIAGLAAAAEVCSWGRHALVHAGPARALREGGLPFSVHGPFGGDELAHWSPRRRGVALDLHRRHASLAAELGATVYVVHPDMRQRPKAWSRKVAARLERSFEGLCRLQDEIGLPVLVENMPYAGHSHFTAPGQLDLRGLGLTLDLGHAAVAGSLPDWLRDPLPSLRHVHLHDNRGRGQGDRHLALGEGDLDVTPALARVRRAGVTVVLEHIHERDVLTSLTWLRERGFLTADGRGLLAAVEA